VLVLSRRGEEFALRLGGAELMNSRAHLSEEFLATYGCAGLREVPGARVLIGGLGMGFTLRAALGALAADAQIEVAELIPEVVEWNRGPLAHLAARPLDDPRVTVELGDVAKRMVPARYHAILLDVDNGPGAFTAPSNASLYSRSGLERARHALHRGGALAVWSVDDDRQFTGRLRGVGFAVTQHEVPSRIGGPRHVLWIGRAP
jgi:spermidine synthase